MDRNIIRRIREVGDPIRAKGAIGLYVYGSRARGDSRADSDLDIFVDYDPDGDFSIVELAGIKRVLDEALGFDVHITTRAGLGARFRQDVERHAVKAL